ncbi:MAG: antibiotic biosynthesis monooxygenase [bacterium]
MIRLRGHLVCVSDDEAAAVRDNLAAHIALTRAEPGCLGFEISPTDDPMVFEVMETFRTRDDFNSHQTRTRASPWFDATRSVLRDFRVEEIGD